MAEVNAAGLDPDEAKVMEALSVAANAYGALPRWHQSELRDFTDAIHRCQDLMALRACQRAFPLGWPKKAPAPDG